MICGTETAIHREAAVNDDGSRLRSGNVCWSCCGLMIILRPGNRRVLVRAQTGDRRRSGQYYRRAAVASAVSQPVDVWKPEEGVCAMCYGRDLHAYAGDQV